MRLRELSETYTQPVDEERFLGGIQLGTAGTTAATVRENFKIEMVESVARIVRDER